MILAKPARFWHVQPIVDGLRQSDIAEFEATQGPLDRGRLSWVLKENIRNAVYAVAYFVADHEQDGPVALGIAHRISPVAAIIVFLGTDAFEPNGKWIARHLRRHGPEAMRSAGITRVECRVWAENPVAVRFCQMIGLERECTIKGSSLDGSDFIQFAQVFDADAPLANDNLEGEYDAIQGSV